MFQNLSFIRYTDRRRLTDTIRSLAAVRRQVFVLEGHSNDRKMILV